MFRPSAPPRSSQPNQREPRYYSGALLVFPLPALNPDFDAEVLLA